MDTQKIKSFFSKASLSLLLPVLLPIAALGAGYLVYLGIANYRQSGALDSTVPTFIDNKVIPTLGNELYKNINKERYGEMDYIAAARGELLVRLKDNVSLSEITMIAYENKMEVLKRFRKTTPSFRLRSTNLSERDESTTSASDQSQSITEPTEDLYYNPNLPESDGTLEEIWTKLEKDTRVYSVSLSPQNYVSNFWPNDEKINPIPGVKPEFIKIRAQQAWDKMEDIGLHPGGSNKYGYESWIAIIDSGVDLDHPDLVDNIGSGGKGWGCIPDPGWDTEFDNCDIYNKGGETPGDLIDNDGDGDNLPPWGIPLPGSEIDETVGHGTNVTGVAAEVGQNNIGAAGLAFNTKIVPLRIADRNGDVLVSQDLIIEAIDYAATLSKVKVVNMSWGKIASIPEEKDAINKLWQAGKVIVGGAGNIKQGSKYEGKKFYPAAYEKVIAVGSVNLQADRSFFSNHGNWVDIAAFGEDLFSTSFWGYEDTLDSLLYESGISGTSFAAPQVSGAVALLRSLYPNLSAYDARRVTIQRASTFYADHGESDLGCGLLNVGDMLVSKAPLIKSPDWCVNRFVLGNDITLEWEPFPGKNSNDPYAGKIPDSYRIDHYEYLTGFFPPKPEDGIDIGNTSSWLVSSDFAETKVDGTWVWKVGAWFQGEQKMYWTQAQTIFKHTAAQISTPKDHKEIGPGELFDWEDIENAHNYALIVWDCLPLNPDPLSYKWGFGWLVDLPGNTSEHTLTSAEWGILTEFAKKKGEYGEPTQCSWAVAGTRLPFKKTQWWFLDFHKHQEFYIPKLPGD